MFVLLVKTISKMHDNQDKETSTDEVQGTREYKNNSDRPWNPTSFLYSGQRTFLVEKRPGRGVPEGTIKNRVMPLSLHGRS